MAQIRAIVTWLAVMRMRAGDVSGVDAARSITVLTTPPSAVGERDELAVVAGDEGERPGRVATPLAPIPLGLLDPGFRAGNEVPPQMPRLGEAVAPPQDEPTGPPRPQRGPPPRSEGQHVRGREGLPAAGHQPFDDVNPAISKVIGQLDGRPGGHPHVEVHET